MPNDIVQSYDGHPIRHTHQLITHVQQTKIGEKVRIGIWREGKQMELTATITEATSPPIYREIPPKAPTKDNMEILLAVGVETRELTASESAGNVRGVVVTRVVPEGSASGILQPDDLIVALNNSPITTPNEFYLHLAASAAVQSTSLFIIRDGQSLRVSLPAPGGEENGH